MNFIYVMINISHMRLLNILSIEDLLYTFCFFIRILRVLNLLDIVSSNVHHSNPVGSMGLVYLPIHLP